MKIVIEIPNEELQLHEYFRKGTEGADALSGIKEAIDGIVWDCVGWAGIPFIVTMQEEGWC